NLSRVFSDKNNISVEEQSLKPVFPVFYSWYNDNSFGTIEVCNEEDSSITDVVVYFYQQQYMGQPRDCAKAKSLKKGEKLTVDLKAFFNENMLSLNEKSDTLANIIVEYKYLGAKRSETFSMVVPVYGRNNMSWEDDRCASAFVSSKDPAAMWFAKYVTSTVRDDIRSGVPQNIQYAMAVFQALDQFGINYVKDPTSAFEDNVGTASIDFLQFPYQTLMYRGGDCDDLSILTCSLFESIGIKTAFITIPWHIFMAFDSGLSLAQATEYFDSLDNFIVDGNKVWVPLEITLSDEGFNKAWHKGAWEWNTANRTGDAMIYPMEESWKIYKPVSVPGAAAKFTLPEETLVAKSFSAMVDEFVIAQITPQIASFENLLVKAPTAQNYNDFGILYARYGLFEQAEEQFRLARISKYLPSILNTANLYYSQKDYTKAAAWYKQVLAADSNNNLAMLGLARCAYETGDYNECDKWYGTVYKNDRTLAKQYSYLGAFEQTSGRSFSLADRLENTVWVQSAEYNMRNGVITSVVPVVPNASVTPQTSAVVLQTSEPVENADGIETIVTPVAIAPGN
ncbi:MAG: tetratricopeptide repeat protein, partial [Spirochaetaceae bacterium]|nr:tetratricopeptide repeat protein [Spirochaetaceae bacterium]